jgi:hypothetical protein
MPNFKILSAIGWPSLKCLLEKNHYDYLCFKILDFSVLKKNRKLRVATEIGSTFFWFLTSYRAAKIVQNDYLSA